MAPDPEDFQVNEQSISLRSGVAILVEATMSQAPFRFSVSLETSQHEEVPFRLSACLDTRVLSLHRRRHCIWEKIQTFASERFPFSSGEPFELDLRLSLADGLIMEISVNGSNMAAVPITRASLRSVTKLRIFDVPNLDGLLSLSDVKVTLQSEPFETDVDVGTAHSPLLRHGRGESLAGGLRHPQLNSTALPVQRRLSEDEPAVFQLLQFIQALTDGSVVTDCGSSNGMMCFQEGHVIEMMSLSTGRGLRICEDGTVDGLGRHQFEAAFNVVVRDDPQVFALQSYRYPGRWLAVVDGLVTHASDAQCCNFKVSEAAGLDVTLESVEHPGMFVSVLPNGDVRPAREGSNSHFRVSTVYV